MEELCLRDFVVSGVNAMNQHWHEGDQFTGYVNNGRSEYGLMLLTGCDARFTLYTGERVEATSGQMVWLPRGMRYLAEFFHVREDSSERCMLVNFQLTDAQGDGMNVCGLAVLDFLKDYELRDRMAEIIGSYQSARYYPALVKAQVYTLLVSVSEKKLHSRPIPERFVGVERCRVFLEQHLAEEVSVEQMARMACLSESGLRKLFHEYLGMSPSQYRLEKRMEQARRLLKAESATVGDVARAIGMEDVNYFSRLFRKKTGISPTEYRRGDLC